MYFQPPLDLTPEEVIDYLRKSRSDDPLLSVEEVLSKHEAILDEWAEKNLGGKVPEENKFREVVSGETLKERPEIQKVLRLIESPKYKALKIIEPQRLTRGDLEDIGRIMKLLKHTNTLIITPQRTYDLRDEYDWDAFERELKRGNEFLEYTKKILMRGKLLSVSQGNYIAPRPPYGYDRTTVMDGKRKCPTLKENKEKADVVRTIFDLYVNQNMGRQRICNYLNNMGIKPLNGKLWVTTTIKNLLENVHYIGKVRWNWRKTIIIVEDSEFVKTRPQSRVGEYLVYEGKHDGIISEDLFYAAQEKMGKNPKIKTNTTMVNPFSSIVSCKLCGKAVSYHKPKKVKGKYQGDSRLLCTSHGACPVSSCSYNEFVNRICDILEDCIEDFEVRITNNAGDSAKLHSQLIKSLEKKMKELNAKELAQWEKQSDPDPEQRMPAAIFKQLNEKILREKEEIQQALCKAYESMPEPVDYEEKVVQFRDALEALKDPNVEAGKKNTLLKACIEEIKYYREKPQRIGKGWNNPPIELDVKLKV